MSYITVDELRIASPCTVQWSDMKGDDFARHCQSCEKNVYDLSLLTSDEANELIREKEGKLCVSLYHRFDGTVLTADCPVGLRTLRRQYLKTRAKAIAFALMVWGFITGTTTSCSTSVGLPALPASFTADVNGNNRSLKIVDAVNDTTVNEIWINAQFPDSSAIWIFIDSTEHGNGTYTNHHGIFEAGGYKGPGKADSNYWYTGELKITDFNPSHIVGSFWFNATGKSADTVYITNGTFDVNVNYGRIAR